MGDGKVDVIFLGFTEYEFYVLSDIFRCETFIFFWESIFIYYFLVDIVFIEFISLNFGMRYVFFVVFLIYMILLSYFLLECYLLMDFIFFTKQFLIGFFGCRFFFEILPVVFFCTK